MIVWEELKHIHVIRKLEQILAQWFQTDVFFLDENGKPKNYDPMSPDRELKNPLLASLLSKPDSRKLILDSMEEAHAAVSKKLSEPHLVLEGPLGLEQIVVSPIVMDGEHLGSVYINCYLEKSNNKKAKKIDKIDSAVIEKAIAQMKVLTDQERRYLFELAELVSHEIVAFHTEITKREDRINALNSELGVRYRYDSMIGKSKAMQDLYSLLDKIKASEATVLIQGENGTGKELIAKALHYNSRRKDAQFVTVNCSAFNENLLDSELFGHVKGAFTGAFKDKKGLFEAAHGGTLFLDEIGDMSLSMQVKLLRVIQEGTLTPVGGTTQIKVDVRVLAATNKDLKEMVELGTFREDLYYRINVINIFVPPLRDRKEDIPILLDHFMIKGCKEKNLPMKTFAKRVMEKILDFSWPGNIRELENEVERLIVLSGTEPRVTVDMMSQRIQDFGGSSSKAQGARLSGKLKDALEELEKTMIKEGLRRTNFNKSRLAKELGISRAGLIMKVDKYDLDKRKLPRDAQSTNDDDEKAAS